MAVDLLLRFVHHGLNLQEGIDALFHSQHFSSSFPHASGPIDAGGLFSEETISGLRANRILVSPANTIGRLTATCAMLMAAAGSSDASADAPMRSGAKSLPGNGNLLKAALP